MTEETTPRRCWTCAEYKKASQVYRPLEHTRAAEKTGRIKVVRCPLKGVYVQALCFCKEWRSE